MMFDPGHDGAPGGGPGAASTIRLGAGFVSSVSPTGDIPGELAARRQAADRCPPYTDTGRRDPLDVPRQAPAGPCTRGFACLAQTLDVLTRVHHCPCAEATCAVGKVVGL